MTWTKCGHDVLIDGSCCCHYWLSVESFMYLQNSASQVLYMDVAAQTHPGSMNLAASLNSMSFNIGIAVGSAVGGIVNDTLGLMWLGPFGVGVRAARGRHDDAAAPVCRPQGHVLIVRCARPGSPRASHRMRAGNGRLSALHLRTIPGR